MFTWTVVWISMSFHCSSCGLFSLQENVSSTNNPVEIPDWEQQINFNPKSETRQQPTWVTLEGHRIPYSVHRDAEAILNDKDGAYDLNSLPLRDPDNFVSGLLHSNVQEWETVLSEIDTNDKSRVLDWIRNGVEIEQFFSPFRGNFKGQSFNSERPPKRFFQNSASCKKYVPFITSELTERVKNGSLLLIGKLNECELPHIIMPLIVEPSKPRLCHDERYLNLWMKDMPFTLETLKDIHRMINKGDELVCSDEKSGYDHVRLSSSSTTYFGIQFAGWVFTYSTLPFGWKISPFVYHTIGMQVTAYIRGLGLSTSQYIDDRILICTSHEFSCNQIIYCLLQILTRLGYTLSFRKSQLTPSTCVKYLGFLINSVKCAYLLPEEKKQKFIILREDLLQQNQVNLTTLQRFAGKCISMNLVVPAAKLYTREINLAISFCQCNSKEIKVGGALKDEILHWRFIDTWEGCVLWRPEFHHQLCIATDASLFKYGIAILSNQSDMRTFGDYWENDDNRPIHLKEGDAVYKAILSLGDTICNHRLDVLTDNKSVMFSWQNQGSKDRQLNDIMKKIFNYIFTNNIDLHIQYIPSKLNAADTPSRVIDMADTMLSEQATYLVQTLFGPHSVDLMATDSNCLRNLDGSKVKHYTKDPTPLSDGINIFSQELSQEENAYVFPPFAIIFPVLKYLQEQKCKLCTFIVPNFSSPMWKPFLMRYCLKCYIIGRKGQTGVLKFPSKNGYSIDEKGLKWDLMAYRLRFR